MKIAIVSAFHRPNWGYEENLWAQQLVHDGHQVQVITAGTENGPVTPVTVAAGAYEERRVKAIRFPHSFFIANVSSALLDYQPDIVMWICPSTYFGRQLHRDPRLAHLAVASFWSENLGMHEFDWRKPGIPLKQRLYAIAWRLLRGGEIRRTLRRSNVIVGNTLQTLGILKLAVGHHPEWPEIEAKYVHFPLGFTPQEFAWDPALREATRQRLQLRPEDLVVCFSSRFDPGLKARDIATAVGGIQGALERRPDMKALVIGFTDNATSDEFRRIIAASPVGERIQCCPFASRQELNEYYNASDMAVFPNASISAQAAIGTGAYVCLADNGSMEDLISKDEQGAFFEYDHPRSLADKLVRAAEGMSPLTLQQRRQARDGRAEAGRWLGYDRILADVFARVPSPGPAASK